MKIKVFYRSLLLICSFIFGYYFVLKNQGVQIQSKYMGFVLIGFSYSLFLTIIQRIKTQQLRLKLTISSLPIVLGLVFLEFYDLKYYTNHEYQMNLYVPPINLYHVYSPNSITQWTNEEYGHYRKINSQGLCDEEQTIKTDSLTNTIIGLGDSFTEGLGAHSDSTWLKFLERKILSQSQTKYQFINAGISGSDPVYEYILLRDKLLKFKPNTVILALGYEINEMIIRGGFERFQNDGTIKYRDKPFWYPLYKISGVFRLFVRICFANEMLLPGNQVKIEEKKAINEIQSIILLFKQLGEKMNFKLVLTIYPLYKETINKKYDYWTETIKFAQKNQIITVDLLKFYIDSVHMNKTNISNYYWPIDGHYNAKGYEKMAEGIYQSIK